MSRDRYARQMVLKEIGIEGQEKIVSAKVVIVGCGALGTTSANLLARAGIGTVVVLDRDLVELSNLQRQALYDESDVGRPKAMAAVERLKQVNADIHLEPIVKDLNHTNVEAIIVGADVVVDGTDNMETRFLLNDACMKNGIPWVYGGAVSTNGMTLTIVPGRTPCFSCVFPQLPGPGRLATCDTVGVLNTITSVVGTIQANEALKLILGKVPRTGLLVMDLWSDEFRNIDVRTRIDCPTCMKKEYDYLRPGPDESGGITTLCGRNAVQVRPTLAPGKQEVEVDLQAVAKRLEGVGEVTSTSYLINVKIKDIQMTIFRDGRAIIKGTTDPSTAKGLYARYVGT